MISVFGIYSVGLLVVSLVLFVIRYVRQDPPVMPYLVIACVCAVGNWLGDLGGGWAAMALLVAASFLFLSCLLYPEQVRRRGVKAGAHQDRAS
ncbi:MAG TPA: hypothetical protein VNH64_09145 [Parvularculaceae bacterium]|nr:hypothetical protein [Parvularculaceae bacterium]